MGLKILAGQLEKLHAHVREGYPYEVVGILAGNRENRLISRVAPLVNERADSARNRYAVSALVMMRAEQALEAEGLEVVGYYHSHPDHPAMYSDFDREHALPNMDYLIVSVQQGAIADTRCWRLTEDRTSMDPQPIGVLMSVSIAIPTALRPYTGGAAVVSVEADTAGAALTALTTNHPALHRHLRTEDGKLRSFVNVYLNEDDIRHLQKEATQLKAGDQLVIVPSIAGGL